MDHLIYNGTASKIRYLYNLENLSCYSFILHIVREYCSIVRVSYCIVRVPYRILRASVRKSVSMTGISEICNVV